MSGLVHKTPPCLAAGHAVRGLTELLVPYQTSLQRFCMHLRALFHRVAWLREEAAEALCREYLAGMAVDPAVATDPFRPDGPTAAAGLGAGLFTVQHAPPLRAVLAFGREDARKVAHVFTRASLDESLRRGAVAQLCALARDVEHSATLLQCGVWDAAWQEIELASQGAWTCRPVQPLLLISYQDDHMLCLSS